ncbi:MAG TPA: ATP-dependent DNA ligase [bacterium]|nr:ATP-dependent DNA ligase [bacterium]
MTIVRYRVVADAYARLEKIAGRLEMIAALADLFRQTPLDLLPKVVYLSQGKIAPDYAGVEIGLAEKLAARSVADATGTTVEKVLATLRRTGDLGTTTEQLLTGRTRATRSALDVAEAFAELEKIAGASGKGAQSQKIAVLAGFIRRATPGEAKYLVRTATGKLRLGVGDATILDALAEVYAHGRANRIPLERAYNVCSDLGLVARAVAEGGLGAAERIEVRPGHPVRPMLAQRLATSAEILEKLGGTCAAEYKYDGERVQVHRQDDSFVLFSRRLERITDQFPDAVELLRSGLAPRTAILEAEIVAIDPEAGELRPFQDLMHRRRKHGVADATRQVPVGLFCFDLLHAGDRDLTRLPYPQRRQALADAITPSDRLRLTSSKIVGTPPELDAYFEEAITDGCEGLMCKSVGSESVYQAGARGWLWIKYKREYRTELQDTLDLVAVGAFHGRGRRRGAFGALLMAAYDETGDVFPTFCKVGAGFTDDDLATLRTRLEPRQVPDRPARVDSRIAPDVWLEPGLVLEIVGAEITLSPVHTVAWGQVREDAGLALRFPRFTGRYRDDKSPEDATTVKEIRDIYQLARHRRAGAH